MFRGAGLSSNGSPDGGQDRWIASASHAVVLDGASSFTPAAVDASEYVDQLCVELTSELRDGGHDLVEVLGTCISALASRLSLRSGEAPSSTVLLAQERGGSFDLLVLGDSTAMVSANGELSRVTDDRLASVGSDIRHQYRSRLVTGSGYDDQHRKLLRRLQERELTLRNTPDGYWIAEADRRAAKEAIVQTFASADMDWCVLATDGAQRPIDHLGMQWSDIAQMTTRELSDLLIDLHRWEEHHDPSGTALPRSKRHDDKAIVVWTPGRS